MRPVRQRFWQGGAHAGFIEGVRVWSWCSGLKARMSFKFLLTDLRGHDTGLSRTMRHSIHVPLFGHCAKNPVFKASSAQGLFSQAVGAGPHMSKSL